MITIPTTELIGCLGDVLPLITDPKSSLAGVRIEWDGEALHCTTYDVYSGVTVQWIPGEGAEGRMENEDDDEIAWGGNDGPWATWVGIEQAKEIVKLFKLPAKLWRFPVTLKCSVSGDRLIVEREDGPRVGRLLMVQADPSMLREIPNVRTLAEDQHVAPVSHESIMLTGYRLAAFASARAHGLMTMRFGQDGDPVQITIGSRLAGFVYPASAKSVPRFNLLRDGAGIHLTSRRETAEPSA